MCEFNIHDVPFDSFLKVKFRGKGFLLAAIGLAVRRGGLSVSF